ncbi:PGC-1 and ERR-induced regulator in muscle protein 1 [Silurus meridionalis]|nr:PGC-1 and ERR-induced regulator in muscle protein 1 [Silurus meridionalis]
MVDPDSVSQPTPPIYAISSFWNEMEKLTINDILGLRLVGQAQHPSVLLPPTDSSITDVTDAADSGYFTHLDESKPDHTSRNMSFISDFDEEPAELLSSDASKPDEGTQKSSNPTGIIWDSNPNLSETANEMGEVLILDTAHSSPLHKSNSTHCFRKMCENISVQNLQALESKNLEKIIRNASVHSMHAEVEGDYVDPFDRVETSSPVYLSDEEEMDNNGITFSEIFEYLFGTEEPNESASEADTLGASYSSGTGTSVLEMYEHFFSDFEPESLFYPTADSTSNDNEIIPIFSSSRSANRNVQFPEVYDYFFPDDSPVHSEEEEEPANAIVRVVTQNDNTSNKNHNSVKNNSWSFLWSNPFSFRRVRHKGITVQPDESSSQALIPVKNSGSSFRGGIQPLNILGADGGPFPDQLIFNLENRIFRQLANQQKICSEMQTTVADPRLDAPLLPIKQADMCLVCIAFASWVMKSVNPQGADTWKAVLLANVSALSAIRYLRRFTRDEAAKISPLRQIKSV